METESVTDVNPESQKGVNMRPDSPMHNIYYKRMTYYYCSAMHYALMVTPVSVKH